MDTEEFLNFNVGSRLEVNNLNITYTVSLSLLNAKILTTSHVPEVRKVVSSLPADCEKQSKKSKRYTALVKDGKE